MEFKRYSGNELTNDIQKNEIKKNIQTCFA